MVKSSTVNFHMVGNVARETVTSIPLSLGPMGKADKKRILNGRLEGIIPVGKLHPGRLTAGTYSHHPFGKENDRNQTSREGHVPAVNLQGCSWECIGAHNATPQKISGLLIGGLFFRDNDGFQNLLIRPCSWGEGPLLGGSSQDLYVVNNHV